MSAVLSPEADEAPGPSPVELRSVAAGRLALLGGAIAGQKISVNIDDVDRPFSDGETVFLPAAFDDASQLLALVAQASLVAAGSLEPRVAVRLIGRASPARRYVSLELARALADPTIPIPNRHRAALRIWDGSPSSSVAESLDMALNAVGIPEAPAALGTIRPRKVMAGSGGSGLLSSMAKKPSDGRQKEMPVDELDDDEDSEESKILKLFSSPFQFENPLFKLMRNQLGMKRRPKPDGDDGGAELPVAGASAVTHVGKDAQLMAAPDDLDLNVIDHEAGDFHYPEWNGHKGTYREDWCAVGEFMPAEGEPDGEFHPVTDFTLRRRLASLGLAYERHRHQADGDGIDVHALVEFAVSKAMGETPDDHVYQTRLKTGHDLGVVVLLDASGSTAHRTNGAPIWNQHRQLAANLIGALEQVGDRVAAYGFNSRGRHHVRFLMIKDFEHRFDASAVRRLATLEPSGFTRIGAAVRHATHIAAEQSGTANRLVVVVSDGFAYDDGYHGRYAERDTRRALDEAVESGVGCMCVSIASDTRAEALERLWGSVSHVRLGEADELSRHVVPMFQSALNAAGSGTRDIRDRGPLAAAR
ncbi:MAG TPA: VWA domain-containing protein [Acidimicrobiales bacterium]